jgi:hypothetical protein
MSFLSLLQDSIWVAGFALPNRDLHPARNAKLLGAPLKTIKMYLTKQVPVDIFKLHRTSS